MSYCTCVKKGAAPILTRFWRHVFRNVAVLGTPNGSPTVGNLKQIASFIANTTTLVSVNVGVAAPVAFFPFSGWKDSFLGDLHAHGTDGVDFYTR